MREIQLKEVLLALLVFLLLSFLARIASIFLVGGLLTNLLPEQSDLPILFAITIAILITGLGVGKFISMRLHEKAFPHALIVAAIAGIYKALRPDLEPLPFLLLSFLSLLNFSAILLGVRSTKDS